MCLTMTEGGMCLAMTEGGMCLAITWGVIATVFIVMAPAFLLSLHHYSMRLRSFASGFCSCLIHQAQLPNKLGNYIFKLAMTKRVRNVVRGFSLVRHDPEGSHYKIWR